MPNEPQAVETEEEVIWKIILQLCSIKWNLYETTPINRLQYLLGFIFAILTAQSNYVESKEILCSQF